VLLNLLVNAKDAFVARKVAAPRIVIKVTRAQEKSVVTITDNAGGVAADLVEKIFEPYFSTKGPEQGTGLGLFISRTLIERHMGGILSVRNVEGGAEFRIEI